MKTILYRIPDRFFPGYKVTKPFHAKVQYEYNGERIWINDVCFSEQCLLFINVTGLIKRMESDIIEAERKKEINPVHPIITSAIAPYITT